MRAGSSTKLGTAVVPTVMKPTWGGGGAGGGAAPPDEQADRASVSAAAPETKNALGD